MKKESILFMIMGFLFVATPAGAHFGMLIPSDAMVMQGDSRTITLALSFSHPFEMSGMEMAKPKAFFVLSSGKRKDLRETLQKTRVMERDAWKASFSIKRPGIYLFCMEPAPYWEPAEDAFIIHFTKTVVAAFGDDEGWDTEVGLKSEIVPLSRPFGLYAGNVFQGIVKLDGKPIPFSEVEVEYYNSDKKYTAPTGYMIAQTIKTDGNGVFTYGAPVPGWWGFAALNTADYKLSYQEKEKDVELGAVIWVYFHEMKK